MPAKRKKRKSAPPKPRWGSEAYREAHQREWETIGKAERVRLEGREPKTREEANRVAEAMSLILSSGSGKGRKLEDRMLKLVREVSCLARLKRPIPSYLKLTDTYFRPFTSNKERLAKRESVKKTIQYYRSNQAKQDLLEKKIEELLTF
jgi:hypothetical protein